MKVNRALRRLSIMLAVLLLLVALAVPAFADAGIDMERSCSLQLSCFYENEAVSGGNLLLYQVAAVESEDGNYYYRERLYDGLILNYGLDEHKESTANFTRAVKEITPYYTTDKTAP